MLIYKIVHEIGLIWPNLPVGLAMRLLSETEEEAIHLSPFFLALIQTQQLLHWCEWENHPFSRPEL